MCIDVSSRVAERLRALTCFYLPMCCDYKDGSSSIMEDFLHHKIDVQILVKKNLAKCTCYLKCLDFLRTALDEGEKVTKCIRLEGELLKPQMSAVTTPSYVDVKLMK